MPRSVLSIALLERAFPDFSEDHFGGELVMDEIEFQLVDQLPPETHALTIKTTLCPWTVSKQPTCTVTINDWTRLFVPQTLTRAIHKNFLTLDFFALNAFLEITIPWNSAFWQTDFRQSTSGNSDTHERQAGILLFKT